MAKDANKTQTESKPEPKRRMLTPEERVARLEAELKAAREKAAAKSRKQADQLKEQRTKLVARRNEISDKIQAIDAQLAELEPTPATDETNVA